MSEERSTVEQGPQYGVLEQSYTSCYFWPTARSSLGYDISPICHLSVTHVLWLNRTS